jgi:hypothetical protein
MAWIEITFKTSEEHEALLDLVHKCFHRDSDILRVEPWSPHISLAYDNPEFRISEEYLLSIVERFPTLERRRRIEAISLWRTSETIDKWERLDWVSLGEM